jgi:hypothetical protein
MQYGKHLKKIRKKTSDFLRVQAKNPKQPSPTKQQNATHNAKIRKIM